MSKTTKLLLGVIGAAAVGVAVGLLIAPDKGSETRKKINKKSKDLRNQMGEMLQSGKDYVTDVAAKLKHESKGLKKDAEIRFDRATEVN